MLKGFLSDEFKRNAGWDESECARAEGAVEHIGRAANIIRRLQRELKR
jgi:hypothetical protein